MEYRGRGLGFSLIQPAQVETAMLDGQGRPRALPQVSPDDVAKAVVGAIRRDRFEVWVPASQAVTAKLAAVLPRSAREAVMRALGVTRIAGDTDLEARRAYHEKAFRQEGVSATTGIGRDVDS
jgi:short-subunit dehydrogenase